MRLSIQIYDACLASTETRHARRARKSRQLHGFDRINRLLAGDGCWHVIAFRAETSTGPQLHLQTKIIEINCFNALFVFG